MERGEARWQMPWHRTGTDITRPRNVATKNPYHGINVPALWAAASEKGYTSGWWGSYKQWLQVGGQVRRGEKASPIVFWKKIQKTLEDQATGETRTETFPIARPWSLFNAEQQDGWTEPEPPKPESPAEVIEHVRRFIANTLAEIRSGGERAYYNVAGDYIQMPPIERFLGTETSTPTEAFHSTTLHELTHWSGSEKRLNRDFSGRFGSETYSFEELVAELGSAFLCSDLRISDVPRDDHARYLRSWIKVLRDDKKAIFTAASQATKAAEFLHSLQPGFSDEGEGKNTDGD
jgi:antirestriction protein ArdC